MGGLRTPESTENNMILNNYYFLLKYTILYTVADVQNLRDGRTLPNFSSHDYFKTDKAKGKLHYFNSFHFMSKISNKKATVVHHS